MNKGILVVSPFWTNFFSAGKASAVTIFPFIFLQDKICMKDSVLINHERIHIRQALELLVLPFYIFYLIEFLVRYCRHGNFKRAYYNISFEREAYENQYYDNYYKTRSFWSFLKYINQRP